MIEQKHKRKLKKPVLYSLIAIITSIIILLISLFINPAVKKPSIDTYSVEVLSKQEKRALKKYPNSFHIDFVKKYGLPKVLDTKKQLLDNEEEYTSKYDLEKIDDNQYYEVPWLLNSLGYLKSGAKDFLDDLGEGFNKKLEECGLRSYRFSISSVLRTLEDQKKLRKINVNATQNLSSHFYGLTFDLAQTRFFEEGNDKPVYSYRLRNLLLRELIKLQDEGKCYVLLENQTKCIHVTVLAK